jgi:Putative mono-oxygenase ydhR
MHLQLITFTLDGISEDAYAEHCAAVAPRFTEQPGLRSKIWIAEPGEALRGGVYLWENRSWAERYTAGPLFGRAATDERLAGVTVRDFDVMDGPTSITRWGFSQIPA